MLVQIAAFNKKTENSASMLALKTAIRNLGLDPAQVEEVDDGVFLAPLPQEWQDELESEGCIEKEVNGLIIEAEMS